MRVGRALAYGCRVGLIPARGIRLFAVCIFVDDGFTGQNRAGSDGGLDEPAGCVQSNQADCARMVKRHARCVVRAKILAPVFRAFFVSDPQYTLLIVSN